MVRERPRSRRPAMPDQPGPVRTCVGCRERAARSELLRVVVGSDQDGRPVAVPDTTGAAAGRGAHLHPETACLDLAIRRRAFGRALRAGPGLDAGPVAEHVAGRSSDPRSTHDGPTRNWSISS